MRGNHRIQVYDPCSAALPLALSRPPQLPRSAGAPYHASGVRSVDQVNGHRFDAVRSYQLSRLGLELRQLQDRDFRRIVHFPYYTAMRYRGRNLERLRSAS